MKLTRSWAEVLHIGYNIRHDTAFPQETIDAHVLMDMFTRTELTIRNVEGLFLVATNFEVCSHVPLSVSSRDFVL